MAHGHCDILISRGDGLPELIPEDVGICFRISPSELPLWTGYQSMQCFPDMMTSFTDPVDKPGLGLPCGWWSVPIPHQWFDATPVLLRQPMRHFPEHNMIDVSERGRGEVRVFVDAQPRNWRFRRSTMSTLARSCSPARAFDSL